jgi:hypothetical protein
VAARLTPRRSAVQLFADVFGLPASRPHTHEAAYEDLYRSVYLPMYDRLKPLDREIRRITGHPPAD